jgi:hypothetical protein
MHKEIWIDFDGVLVYQTGLRTTKTRVLLTKEELEGTIPLLGGTITKFGKTFIAPLKRIS